MLLSQLMVHGKSEDIHQKLESCFFYILVNVKSVRNGKVLDYIVKSLVYHTCQNYKNKHKTEEYIHSFGKHSFVCYENHKGSSDSMRLEKFSSIS